MAVLWSNFRPAHSCASPPRIRERAYVILFEDPAKLVGSPANTRLHCLMKCSTLSRFPSKMSGVGTLTFLWVGAYVGATWPVAWAGKFPRSIWFCCCRLRICCCICCINCSICSVDTCSVIGAWGRGWYGCDGGGAEWTSVSTGSSSTMGDGDLALCVSGDGGGIRRSCSSKWCTQDIG